LSDSSIRWNSGVSSFYFHPVLHGEADVVLGVDRDVVDHAVPEAGVVLLQRFLLLFQKLQVVLDPLAAGVLVVDGSRDFIEAGLCLFVPGAQGFVGFLVLGLVLGNVGVLVDAVLDLPGDEVYLSGELVFFPLQGGRVKGGILDGAGRFR
jgi:hypothetical protein